jgi:transposase
MEQIYGIDLSKEKFDVSFMQENDKLTNLEVKNKYSSICDFLSNLNKESTLCIEHTGIYGDLLIFLANSYGIRICAVPGYEIKHSLGLQKGKSDQLDASRIREYGERFGDKLRDAVFPLENLHELRELHSMRELLVKQRKMLITHLKEKGRSPFRSIQAKAISDRVMDSLYSQIREIEAQIHDIILADEALFENSQLIVSIKGIGSVTANELIIKTQNFKKIPTARQASSFAGVCPFPDSSGKMVRKSKVSRMSDKSLKTLLFLCAASAIQYNKDIKHYYERKIYEGKPKHLALNNVANKLLRTVYALVESRQMYDPNYICLDPRNVDKIVA